MSRPRLLPNPTTVWCPTCKAPAGQRCRWPRGEARDDDDSHRTRYRAVGTVRGNQHHGETRQDGYLCTACKTWARFGEYHGLDVCQANLKRAALGIKDGVKP